MNADNEDRVQEEADNALKLIETKTNVDCASVIKGNNNRYSKGYDKKWNYLRRISPSREEVHHICSLVVVGTLSWGLAYLMFGDEFSINGAIFRLGVTAVLGFVAGQLFEKLTTLPPLLGMLTMGIILRHIDFININNYNNIDAFLRKMYPVIILGKSSLGWDYRYMKTNWVRVMSFGVLPWFVEMVTFAVCIHHLLLYPWKWAFLLGSVFPSLSAAVLIPAVQELHGRGLGTAQEMPKLLGTAGGMDTVLSVGVYGLMLTAVFSEDYQGYIIFRACLTLFAGAILGIFWGYFANLIPSKNDYFVAELRLLVVLVGGMFANFGTLAVQWGGTGGVAVLLCNFTAGTLWSNSGWKLNNNPVAAAYRILWTIFEPMLFTFTGAYIVISELSGDRSLRMLAVLAASLFLRLMTVFILGCSTDITLKERLFVCIMWMPKSIVEAVLAPTALDILRHSNNATEDDLLLGQSNIQFLVLAILITTPIAYLLIRLLGPVLLADAPKDKKGEPIIWTTQIRNKDDVDKLDSLESNS